MIHYHGTPLTPRAKLLELAGRSFCVRFGRDQDLKVCHEIGEGVMLDNGAFSAWTKDRPTDWPGFAEWARPWLDYRTTWAVMPDVIGGGEEDNDRLITWLYVNATDVWRRSAPVWHMHEPIDRLKRLCHGYARVCIGSSAEYAEIGTERWHRRMDCAMNTICGSGAPPAWLHMLRGLDLAGSHYPFSSADSTNVAQNHVRNGGVVKMAQEIDGRQCPPRWTLVPEPMELAEKPEPVVIEPDRFRLIPTRGRGHSWHVYGAEEARADAERYVSENEIGVLVCAAPEKGIVRELYTVKAPEKPRAKKRSAA